MKHKIAHFFGWNYGTPDYLRGLRGRKGGNTNQDKIDTLRIAKMWFLRKKGKTYREIASEFGVSHQRVRQILLKNTINLP